jgi:hypothetical protein
VSNPHRMIALILLASAGSVAASAQTPNQIVPLTLPNQVEVPVSPSTPSSLLSGESTGSNPLTGLPCTGAGSLAVSSVGETTDTSSSPADSTPTAPQLPTVSSVFGSSSSLGSC